MLEIGSLVDGKYKILNKVGQGGMSVVYLAMNEKANKQWAVKEVRKDGIKDFEVVKQGLVAETDILKKLSHPHLPSIVDVIDTDDSFIIIMDYIQGNSLNKAIEEYGAQPQEYVIDWAKQLCDVLGYLHSRTPAIIYRDMKPANVMLKPDGNVTLIDFGTAREFKEKNLADTTCLGTVGYAAPEQFGGMGQTDARTDIYCLGATLYHLVTGMNPCEPPYEIKPIREINPTLSSGFERIILKCTQRDPNDRYQSTAELMYALEHYEEIDDVYRKKQKKKLWSFITTSILTVVFAIMSVWGYVSAEKKKGENYDNLILEANSAETTEKASEVVDRYYQAILADPTRTEAYLGLNDFLASDYQITSEEFQQINQLISGLDKENVAEPVKVLEQLKTADKVAYDKICFEFGWSYISYFNSGKEVVAVDEAAYSHAAEWFKEIKENKDDNGNIASLFCDISEYVTKIKQLNGGKFVQINELDAQYTNLWKNIKDLKTKTDDYSEDYKLQVWKHIEALISNYGREFLNVTTPDEIVSVLNEINSDITNIKATNSNIVKIIDELKTSIAATIVKVESDNA